MKDSFPAGRALSLADYDNWMKKKGQFHEDAFNRITGFTAPTFLEIKKKFKDYCASQGLNNADGHFNSTHPRYQEVEAKRREVAQWAANQGYDSLRDPPPFGSLKMPNNVLGAMFFMWVKVLM
jgi:hypothetical protein